MTNYIEIPTQDDLITIEASRYEITDFLSSMLHKDFQNACDIEITELTQCLDDPEMRYSGRDYDKFRGAKEAMTRIKDIFSRLLEGVEENKKEIDNVI